MGVPPWLWKPSYQYTVHQFCRMSKFEDVQQDLGATTCLMELQTHAEKEASSSPVPSLAYQWVLRGDWQPNTFLDSSHPPMGLSFDHAIYWCCNFLIETYIETRIWIDPSRVNPPIPQSMSSWFHPRGFFGKFPISSTEIRYGKPNAINLWLGPAGIHDFTNLKFLGFTSWFTRFSWAFFVVICGGGSNGKISWNLTNNQPLLEISREYIPNQSSTSINRSW